MAGPARVTARPRAWSRVLLAAAAVVAAAGATADGATTELPAAAGTTADPASGEVTTDAATLQLQQYDALRVARCTAVCWGRAHDAKDGCVSACLRSSYSKPGACPDVSTLSAFDVACIDACSGDADCSATDKCCTHACGVTCQAAQGLDAAPGLPPVPSNVSATERRHGRTAVVVDWVSPAAPPGVSPVLFVVEERHHVGWHLALQRMGPWTARHRSSKHSATLRGVVRPGRWYEFRVAAINANGSRGFSQPSMPFQLSVGPKPPGLPLNLTVGPAAGGGPNATLRWVLRWEAPESDLPVQRYKVFWSRRLDDGLNSCGGGGGGGGGGGVMGNGGAGHTARPQGTVLVHHQTVGGDVLQFSLKSLEPNSLYFLQVQAIAQYGRERLKGDKAAIFLNMRNFSNNGSSC